MSFHRRIYTIYSKELTDILRDRRTLLAMIVVPIVLYPLLMLGSIQAISYQAESLGKEELVIGVVGGQQRFLLLDLIQQDRHVVETEGPAGSDSSESDHAEPVPFPEVRILVYPSEGEIEQAVRQRHIHAGFLIDSEQLLRVTEYERQISIRIFADKVNLRSAHTQKRLQQLMSRTTERINQARLARENLPRTFIEPFQVEAVDLSAPPAILGQVLPLILILMTITGAIYPAIDLTAGERERGTLESLMVSPVPVFDLIVGKFLVVTTVAIMGATLNITSVTATVYFGGFDQVISTTGGQLPLGKMALILTCLIPFAVMMSAIMIAVCSYARTFKEAQNYVTPVVLAVLIPGGIAALPATKLEGMMLVMPVGNMVLLSRDLLVGATVPMWHGLIVLLATSLYAGAAVAVAASVFGQEAVIFSDVASFRSTFSRRWFRPAEKPGTSLGLLFVALLFPVWFLVQSIWSPNPGEDARDLVLASGWLMPLLFVVAPVLTLRYFKINVRQAMALRGPGARYVLSAILLGLSAWVFAHELNVLQHQLFGVPQFVLDNAKALEETLRTFPAGTIFVLMALVPAVSEELLFRGFLLSSLRSSSRKWPPILLSAFVFSVFHFFFFRMPVTAGLGVLLAYLCWQSRSVVPPMIAHFLHNAMAVLPVVYPEVLNRFAVLQGEAWDHLPPRILLVGGLVFLVGLLLLQRRRRIESACGLSG